MGKSPCLLLFLVIGRRSRSNGFNSSQSWLAGIEIPQPVNISQSCAIPWQWLLFCQASWCNYGAVQPSHVPWDLRWLYSPRSSTMPPISVRWAFSLLRSMHCCLKDFAGAIHRPIAFFIFGMYRLPRASILIKTALTYAAHLILAKTEQTRRNSLRNQQTNKQHKQQKQHFFAVDFPRYIPKTLCDQQGPGCLESTSSQSTQEKRMTVHLINSRHLHLWSLTRFKSMQWWGPPSCCYIHVTRSWRLFGADQVGRGCTMTRRSATASTRKDQQPSATSSHQETLFSSNHQQHGQLRFVQGNGQHLQCMWNMNENEWTWSKTK